MADSRLLLTEVIKAHCLNWDRPLNTHVLLLPSVKFVLSSEEPLQQFTYRLTTVVGVQGEVESTQGYFCSSRCRMEIPTWHTVGTAGLYPTYLTRIVVSPGVD